MNPKAPRLRRNADGTLTTIDPFESVATLPYERMRALDATDAAVSYFREAWEAMDEADQANWRRDWDVATDAELREELAVFEASLSTESVPDGTADDVLGWVGADTGRARQALASEQGRDKPRKTLVKRLSEIVG